MLRTVQPHVCVFLTSACVQGRHTKLGHRVEFPKELKLCNTIDDDTVRAAPCH